MAVLICLCGERMGGSACPNDNFVEIYRREFIDQEIQKNLEFMDLWNKDYIFWYCPVCKRLTLTSIPRKTYDRSYIRTIEEIHPEFAEVSSWQEILFWRDWEFYNAIEADAHQPLAQFVRENPPRYLIRLSPDETTAHVFRPDSHEYLFSYVQEPMPDFEKLDGKDAE
ncbi:MAG: hypothetical protein J5654_02150 [Victivallales bacterium]|nr:hypothetical protein [Victivallales bacterium]